MRASWAVIWGTLTRHLPRRYFSPISRKEINAFFPFVPMPNKGHPISGHVRSDIWVQPFLNNDFLLFLECCREVVRKNLSDCENSSFLKIWLEQAIGSGNRIVKTTALEVWEILLTHKMLQWERIQEFMLEMRKLRPQEIKEIAQGQSVS